MVIITRYFDGDKANNQESAQGHGHEYYNYSRVQRIL